MSLLAKRLASAAASALLLTLISPAAHAATDVLTLSGSVRAEDPGSGTLVGQYTFNSSMILNSIGVMFDDLPVGTEGSYYFDLKGQYTNRLVSTFSAKDANGVAWLPLEVTMNAGETVRVYSGNRTIGYSANSGTNVSYNGFTVTNSLTAPFDTSRTNSNIRVTPLGGSVAPEPGSIALLLTGGGALAGIALRRRRNAS